MRLFGLERVRELGMIPNEYLAYYEQARAIVRRMRERGDTRGQQVAAQQRGFFDERFDGPADALAGWRRARDARHLTYMDEAGGDRDDRSRHRSNRRPVGRGLRRCRGGVPARRRDRRRGTAHLEHGEHGAAPVPRRRRRGGGADVGGPRGVRAGRGQRPASRAAGAGDPCEGGRTPDAPRLVGAVRCPRGTGGSRSIPSSTLVRSPNGSSPATWNGSRGSRTCSTRLVTTSSRTPHSSNTTDERGEHTVW